MTDNQILLTNVIKSLRKTLQKGMIWAMQRIPQARTPGSPPPNPHRPTLPHSSPQPRCTPLQTQRLFSAEGVCTERGAATAGCQMRTTSPSNVGHTSLPSKKILLTGRTEETANTSIFVSYCCSKVNCHPLSGLKQYQLIIFYFWRAEVQTGSLGAMFLLGALGKNTAAGFFKLLEGAHNPWLMPPSHQSHPSNLCLCHCISSPYSFKYHHGYNGITMITQGNLTASRSLTNPNCRVSSAT